jgi:molybdenum cofactor cytidylyltransferase
MRVHGILLAAGAGSRFGAHKLLAPLPDGAQVCRSAARALLAATDRAVAVVRPGDAALSACLAEEGMEVVECTAADRGMGASLACGAVAVPADAALLVALADMPWIRAQTVAAVAAALSAGARLAAPIHGGRRGHPVGFSPVLRPALLALDGDAGARAVVEENAADLVGLMVDDPGAVLDVDTPEDLVRHGVGSSAPVR